MSFTFTEVLETARKLIEEKREKDIIAEQQRIARFRESIKENILESAKNGRRSVIYSTPVRTDFSIPVDLQEELEKAGFKITYEEIFNNGAVFIAPTYKTTISWT